MLVIALRASPTFSAGLIGIVPLLVAGHAQALLRGARALHCEVDHWIQVQILHVGLLDLHTVHELCLQT